MADTRTVIRRAQQTVLSSNPDPYYKKYHRYERRYWREIPHWLRQHPTKPVYPQRILDIGCAYGTLMVFSRMCFKADVFGIDIWPRISRRLINRYLFRCSVGTDIEIDPLPWDLDFDMIIMTEILEHFRIRPEPTLLKIADHLSPTGKIYISTPNREMWCKRGETWTYDSLEEMSFVPESLPNREEALRLHNFLYTREELEALAARTGLYIQKFSGDHNYSYNLILAREPV